MFLCASNLYSQLDSTLLLKGKVMNTAFRPLGFAHIWNKNGSNGTVATIQGEFKLYVNPGEEILVSSLGYKSQKLKIPNTINKKLYKTFYLRKDTIQLKETIVRPWPATYHKLKEKISAMDLEDKYAFNTQDEFLKKEMNTAQRLALRNIGIAPVTISGPFSLLYAAFGDKPKQIKQLPKDKLRFHNEKVIKNKFNLEIIKKVTKMQNADSINNFIAYCDFDTNYLLEVDKYALLMEIQKKFEEFCLENVD